MINPGELNEKITILTLNLADNTYEWGSSISVWAKAEPLKCSQSQLSSRRRPEAKSVKFTMRKCAIAFDQAILWRGKHYTLVDIAEIDHMYYEVTVAMAEPKTCTVSTTNMSLGPLNRPVISNVGTLTFPGYLLEKYSTNRQKKPMSLIEMYYTLIVPEVIGLEAGKIVEIEDQPYEVRVLRLSKDYKNEYEVRVRRDA